MVRSINNKKYIILTGGDGGYGNLGDEWLLASVKARYKHIKDRFRILVLMKKPPVNLDDGFEYLEDDLGVFQNKIINNDSILMVHYYGGGYINDYWSREKLWLYNFLVKGGFDSKKIFFTCQGVGPISDKILMNNIKGIAINSALFGVRDNNYSNQLGGKFMFDESIFLSNYNKHIFPRKKELWVNFRIASHVGLDKYKMSFVLEKIKRLADIYGLKIKFFSMVAGEDFNEADEMLKLLMSNNIKITRPVDYSHLLKIISRSAAVITTSYHATLAAIYTMTPVLAIYENNYYNLKFTGLKECIESSIFNIENVANIDGYKLQGLLLNKYDKNTVSMLDNLKKYNNKGYDNIYNYINKL